ncbi:hypothetical protein D3C86_1764230 [compost metagenome]
MQHLLDHARNTDAFEHHARLWLGADAEHRHRALDVVTGRRCHIDPGLIRGLLGRIDYNVGAHSFCQRAALGREIRGHHRADTARLEHGNHGQADGAATDHDRDLVTGQRGTINGVNSH